MKPVTLNLGRQDRFSFACQACGRCCHHQRIALSPYEIVRLARGLAMTTGQLIEQYTDEGGTILRFVEGQCVFLDPAGKCSVYRDRPLACRLYPLARYCHSTGEELFGRLELVEGCEAICGTDGTVEEVLMSQEVAPYLHYTGEYYSLYRRMVQILQKTGDPRQLGRDEARELDDFNDVDAGIARLAQSRDADSRVELHISMLHRWLDEVEKKLSEAGE